MAKLPALPLVHPVVRRALLGVALGAAGCAKEVIVRVRNPGPGPMPPEAKLENACVGSLQTPDGKPLVATRFVAMVAGQPRPGTTNEQGYFSVLLPDGTDSVDIVVEGFATVQCQVEVSSLAPIVLTPATTDAPP